MTYYARHDVDNIFKHRQSVCISEAYFGNVKVRFGSANWPGHNILKVWLTPMCLKSIESSSMVWFFFFNSSELNFITFSTNALISWIIFSIYSNGSPTSLQQLLFTVTVLSKHPTSILFVAKASKLEPKHVPSRVLSVQLIEAR